MQMKVCRAIFLLTAFAAGTAAAMAQYKSPQQPAPEGAMPGMKMEQAAPKPLLKSGPLKITFGDKSAEWTPATLAALPHQSVTVINGHTKESLTFSGVSLMDLLTPLGVPNKSEGPLLKLYLVAEGADGYKVVYSLPEVASAVSRSTVIVADTLDGKPLAGNVYLKLVNNADKGLSRCVQGLVAIRVLAVE
jgi:hypothetical protein